MVGQTTGATPALRWHRFIRAGLAAALLMGIGTVSAPAGEVEGAIRMELPPRVTITLQSGRTISGVLLAAVGQRGISYKKGGKRFLIVVEVKKISFSGPVLLERRYREVLMSGKVPSILFPENQDTTRGNDCRKPREIATPVSAMLLKSNGEALYLDPRGLEPFVVKDLRQARRNKFLLVESLQFDPDGKVRLKYKCANPVG
jgi:hypothetical protein